MTISESKGIGTAFIAIAGSIGAALPLFFKQLGNHNLRLARAMGFIQRCFTAIGAGVVLATGFVHIMPDGIEAVEDAGWNMEAYPYGYLIALCGVVAFYLMEAEMHNFVSEAQGPTAKIHIVEAGIAVHSILVGVAFGTEEDDQTAKVLSIALCFHQMCEGLAMGPLIRRGMKSLPHGLLLVMIFALSAPIGIMIGWLVYVFSDPDQAYSQAIQGVFDLIAAGLLIYVGCAEFLGELVHPPELHQHEEEREVIEGRGSNKLCHENETDDTVTSPDRLQHNRAANYSTFFGNGSHQRPQDKAQVELGTPPPPGDVTTRNTSHTSTEQRQQRQNFSSPSSPEVEAETVAVSIPPDVPTTTGTADGKQPANHHNKKGDIECLDLVDDADALHDDFSLRHPTLARLITHTCVLGGAAVMSVLAIWS